MNIIPRTTLFNLECNIVVHQSTLYLGVDLLTFEEVGWVILKKKYLATILAPKYSCTRALPKGFRVRLVSRNKSVLHGEKIIGMRI